MKEWVEYALAWAVLKAAGAMPRWLARRMGSALAALLLRLTPKLRRTAEFNLKLAFPDWTADRRRDTLREMTRSLGWMAAEFARMPRYTAEDIERAIVLDGHENFLAGQRRGKGVLFLTAHLGAWELSSYAHALYGHPLHFMARPLDNRRLDGLVNRYRGFSGNVPVFKNQSARAVLKVLKAAGTVGILADQNTMPDEGAFVDFFGTPASTTTGIARMALHTGAAVVPSYAVWDPAIRKYRLRFEPPLELIRSGDAERDVLENTRRYAKVTEEIIRKYPGQWVWIHARWKTRPAGEPPLYDFL
jgi:KDO2-lipid IV(A) lauroyltransferase